MSNHIGDPIMIEHFREPNYCIYYFNVNLANFKYPAPRRNNSDFDIYLTDEESHFEKDKFYLNVNTKTLVLHELPTFNFPRASVLMFAMGALFEYNGHSYATYLSKPESVFEYVYAMKNIVVNDKEMNLMKFTEKAQHINFKVNLESETGKFPVTVDIGNHDYWAAGSKKKSTLFIPNKPGEFLEDTIDSPEGMYGYPWWFVYAPASLVSKAYQSIGYAKFAGYF